MFILLFNLPNYNFKQYSIPLIIFKKLKEGKMALFRKHGNLANV